MRITIFTPTYNRAYIIQNLYNSLLKQTFKDFEWVVVNDGSTDNTEQLFARWKKKAPFHISYVKQENGGKHRAINTGINISKGDLFFIVDSDDFLPNDSLEKIDIVEKSIPLNLKPLFAGVCGLKGKINGTNLGSTYQGNVYLDITQLDREKYGIHGDKAEVFYTKLLKQYKFPEFDGETFVTECVVWDKIAFDGFKLRFFNDTIYLCEYLYDGLTNKYWDVCYSNPRGYGLYIRQSINYGKLSRKDKWKEINRFFLNIARYSFKEKASFLCYSTLYCFIGLLLYRSKRKINSLVKRILKR